MERLLVQSCAAALGACLHCRELLGPTQLLGRDACLLLQLYIFHKTVVCRDAVIEHLGRTVEFQRHGRAIEYFIECLIGQFLNGSLQIGLVTRKHCLNLLED